MDNRQLANFKEQLKIINQSKSTISAYTACIQKFLTWLEAQNILDVRAVTGRSLNQYQLELMSKNYSLETVHLHLRALRRFFEYLVNTNQILLNPTEKLKFPKLGKRLPKIIPTEAEINKLLNTPNTGTKQGIRNKTILELLYSSGIRRNECANLTIHDVDYSGGLLKVTQGKGKKDRVVPIGEQSCKYLKEYILKVRPHYLKNKEERALFINRLGQPLSSQMVGIMVREETRKAGIKINISPHAIRRAFATHLIKHEAHPLYVQRLLGHSQSETLNKYVKVAGIEVKQTHLKTHPREKDKR